METLFGLGLMGGPFIGSLLYELGGFYLPFVVCGGAMVICSIATLYLFQTKMMKKRLGNGDAGETDGEETDREASSSTTYCNLLRVPGVLYSCVVLGLSGISISWYLPTLQPFLEDTLGLGTLATGALLVLDGGTYALFTPFWGWVLDAKKMSPLQALLAGNVFIVVGYSLLGPAPFLPFLSANVYLVAIGMTIHGFGVASNFITTLTLMLSSSIESERVPDTEQTRGMFTSLWFIHECVGGYLGSAGGGLAYDKMGFRNSTVIVIAVQVRD